MATFSIDPAVFELFPTARFAAVVVRGVDNRRENPCVGELLDASIAQVRHEFATRDPKTDPRIAVWRDTFSTRGWTPSKYLSSIEALVRRIAKGSDLPRISPAVDLANSVSLTHVVPIGAHDLGTAPDGIVVRLSEPDDRFLPMGEAPAESLDDGEIVYVHAHDVRTRRWVWRQSRTGLVSAESTDFLFPVDGFAPATEQAVHAAAARLAELVPELLGGCATVYHLDPDHPSTD